MSDDVYHLYRKEPVVGNGRGGTCAWWSYVVLPQPSPRPFKLYEIKREEFQKFVPEVWPV